MRFSTDRKPGGRNCQFQISGMAQCGKSFLASKRQWSKNNNPYASTPALQPFLLFLK